MSFTQDFFTSRRPYRDGNTRVNSKDRLWYDPITNTIRIGDGETPGGIIVGSGEFGPLGGTFGSLASNVANLQSQINFIRENLDSTALDSLTEIVAEIQTVNISTLANLSSITSNIELQQANITSLFANAVSQQANINTLIANTVTAITSVDDTVTIVRVGANVDLSVAAYVREGIKYLYADCRNDDTVTITKGTPVYLYAATGNRPTVRRAKNTSDQFSAKTLGLASENIAVGQHGLILVQGMLTGIDTSMFAEGDTIYLGATDGSITNVKPYAPNHLVYLGVVVRTNHGQGEIYVRPQNGYELHEIHDVNINHNVPLSDGQILVYNASAGLWENRPLVPNFGNISGNLVPGANVTYDLGSPTLRWRDLYLSGSTIDLGGSEISKGEEGIAMPTGSTIGGINPGTIVIKGLRTDPSLLPTLNLIVGDGYIINRHLWVWSGEIWVDVGIVEGPKGSTGATGSAGPTGLGFSIAKIYTSVALLQADTNPVDIVAGQFAIINTPTVEDPENAKLYLWTGENYVYTIDLSGAAGLQGPPGATGTVGATGIQGATGPQGIPGTYAGQGATGSTGEPGSPGGATGATGMAGPIGTTGATGTQGNIGPIGSTGATGPQGFLGPRGATGSTGVQGPEGSTGATGFQGIKGNVGSTGPQGNIGSTGATGLPANIFASSTPPVTSKDGDKWYDTDTGILYVKITDSGTSFWLDISTPILGPIGATGATGLQGNVGATGATGPLGLTGPPGATGATGIQGITGETGATGSMGPQGNAGATGATGSQGVIGSTGATGLSAQLFVGNTVPTGANAGDHWLDTDNMIELVYYQDSDSTQWIEITGRAAAALVAGGAVIGATGPQGLGTNIAIYDENNLVTANVNNIKFLGQGIRADLVGNTVCVTIDIESIIAANIPKIANIQITGNTYSVINDTAVSTNGGYIKLNGSGFMHGCSVIINNVFSSGVTFINSTQVNAQVPATAAGTYAVYLVNPDGGTAIGIPGLTFI